MVREKYDPKYWEKEIVFEKIKPRYKVLIDQFQSYQAELRDFLLEDGLRSQEMCISSTFLVFEKSDHKKHHIKHPEKMLLLGYITISADSIRLDGTLKEFFRNKDIPYKALPAIKIGRLCVDDRYLRKGLGKCMLAWAVKRVAYLNAAIACRFITLDAKRHPESEKDSYHFYRKFGFEVLKSKKTDREIAQQKTGATPMYLDLYKIIIEILEKQKNKGLNNGI